MELSVIGHDRHRHAGRHREEERHYDGGLRAGTPPRGLDAEAAIREACLLRFRPIMMTTFAAIFGALPIALGSGEGAELRQPLAVAVGRRAFCCRSCSPLIITPVIYVYLDRIDRVPQRPARTAARGFGRGAAQAGGRGGIIIDGQASGRARGPLFRLGNAGCRKRLFLPPIVSYRRRITETDGS